MITEEAGWDGLFVWDHMLVWNGNEVHDPWMLLAVAAASTERVVLGPMVTPLPRRRPWQVARQALTLDHISGGRCILGVGIGAPPEVEFEWFGEPADARERADMLDEGLEVVLGLWTGERFAHDGTHYRLHEMTFRPRPVQRPRIPIWVGGGWPAKAPFIRAARFEGVYPIDGPSAGFEPLDPSTIAEIADLVHRHRTSPEPFEVSVFLAAPDDQTATDLLAAYRQAGVTWVQVGPLFDEPPEEFLARVKAGPPS